VDFGQQSSGCFQLAVDERRVQDQPCGIVGDLRLPPQFNLALQGLEIPLDSVHAYRERINQVEALGVLGQDRREHAWDNVSKFPRVLTSQKTYRYKPVPVSALAIYHSRESRSRVNCKDHLPDKPVADREQAPEAIRILPAPDAGAATLAARAPAQVAVRTFIVR